MTEVDERLDDAVHRTLRIWAEASGADLCVLFGSRAGKSPAVFADVDVAVRFPTLPPPERRLEIIGELQAAVGFDRVDVVFLHPGTEPVLNFEIFRTGRPVYESTPGLFVDETVRALMLFEDALPFRRARRERLRRIAEGGSPLVA